MIFKQNKLINNRNKVDFFSMDIDKNGNQHLVWIENKNGQYNIVYKFWNGIQWEFLEKEVIYESSKYITYSDILIVNNIVNIIYVKEGGNISTIGLIEIYQSKKTIKEYKINSNLQWVSIIKDSTEKQRPYIISHDGESFSIYKITDENIILEGNKDYSIQNKENFKKIKVSNTKDNFTIFISNINNIEFNFFNYKNKTWANNSFIKLNSSINNNIIDFNIKGILNNNKVGVALLNQKDKEEIKYIETDENGNENYLENVVIFSRGTNLNSPNNFYIAGYTNISISYDKNKPIIFALGTQNSLIKYDLSWEFNIIKSNIKIDKNIFIFNSYNICAISNGNIYFFNLKEEDISPENSSVSLFNSKRFIVANWVEGEFINKKSINNIFNNTVGDIFLDSKNNKIITVLDEQSSSSSTSSSSSSSSSSTSLSSSSSTSLSSSSSTSLSSSSSSSSFLGSSSSSTSESSSSSSSSSISSSSSSSSSSTSSSSSSSSSSISSSSSSSSSTSSSSSSSSSSTSSSSSSSTSSSSSSSSSSTSSSSSSSSSSTSSSSSSSSSSSTSSSSSSSSTSNSSSSSSSSTSTSSSSSSSGCGICVDGVNLAMNIDNGTVTDVSDPKHQIGFYNALAALSSSQAYVGSHSISCSGDGDYALIRSTCFVGQDDSGLADYNSCFNLGSNDFDIRIAFYPTANDYMTLIAKWGGGGTNDRNWTLDYYNSGGYQFLFSWTTDGNASGFGISALTPVIGGGSEGDSLPLNTWYEVRVAHSSDTTNTSINQNGDNFVIQLDGVTIGSGNIYDTIWGSNQAVTLGNNIDDPAWNVVGYVDYPFIQNGGYVDISCDYTPEKQLFSPPDYIGNLLCSSSSSSSTSSSSSSSTSSSSSSSSSSSF